ncbi:hypothetical protein IFM89_036197 [Coptis chinensis]|uniref:NAC domain-containing protein n=1 Tax=Coptis chinensis TaxID=261450 RepID=A0A835ISV8_9MAGN|nr:hypothetical protein IFM89_036197 [Coptis chinensis]
MGEEEDPKNKPLPPGFRFNPTEQQLFSFYLANKNKPTTSPNNNNKTDVIPEIDSIYNYDPYDLPEIDSFPYGYGGGKKHWYYFTLNGGKKKRNTKGGGFWKRKCRTSGTVGGVLLGTKTSFVFYKRDSEKERRCFRTDWMMIEYALVDHQMDFFVLCRVYLKSCSDNKVMKVGLNSHTEDSFAAKNNNVDGASASGIGEVVVRQDNQVAVRPFSDNGVGSLGVVRSDQLIGNSNRLIVSGYTFDDVDMDELKTNTIFLEGDYLELDDLVGPLLAFGSSG